MRGAAGGAHSSILGPSCLRSQSGRGELERFVDSFEEADSSAVPAIEVYEWRGAPR